MNEHKICSDQNYLAQLPRENKCICIPQEICSSVVFLSRFTISGYQAFRLDREGRNKGGVLILVRNNIAASHFKVDTNQQAEIHGVNITVDNSTISILSLYCPPDKDLSLRNRHSTTSWGYGETQRREDEAEDWQIVTCFY